MLLAVVAPVLARDADRDGIRNQLDNCRDVCNLEQKASDRDGVGDPTPAPPPDGGGGGTLTFLDTFDRENGGFVPPWGAAYRAAADRLTTTSAVARKGTHSAKFTVHDSDVLGYAEPRAQLNKGGLLCEGTENYLGWSILFPNDFPRELPSGGWLMIAEHGFGPPWGYPPTSFVLRDRPAGHLILTGAREDGHPNFWSTPITYGAWMDIVMHVNWSSDPSVGYIELWLNGTRQNFTNGQDRIYVNTLRRDATGCGHVVLNNYRATGMFEWVTLYHDEMKVGTSYAAVAP